MISMTEECRRFGHPEFVLTYDESLVPATDVAWLLKYLTESVAAGERYAPGQLIRVGWTENVVSEAGCDRMELLEPDWKGGLPVRFTTSVTRTLVDLRRQRDLVDSVGLIESIAFPSMRERAIICDQLGISGLGIMSRARASGRDSGWFLGCGEHRHDHDDPKCLQSVSLYEAACRVPVVVQFLAFPAGAEVLFAPESPILVRLNGKRLVPGKDSYLDRLMRKAASE